MTSKKEFIGMLTTILAVYFSACGLIYYTTYYSVFGIKVLSFLDTSEIFLGIFEALYLDVFKNGSNEKYWICLVILIVQDIVLVHWAKPLKAVQLKWDFEKRSLSWKNISYCLFLASTTGLTYTIYRSLIIKQGNDYVFVARFFNCFFLFICVYTLYEIIKEFAKRGFNATQTGIYFLIFFASFLFFTVSLANKNANLVKQEGYKAIRFEYDNDTTISTTENLIFVGGLKNYFFLYRKDLSKCKGMQNYMVFEREKVKFLHVYSDTSKSNFAFPNDDLLLCQETIK